MTYKDEYMNFQFGEFDSEQFNTYIVRNGEKLSFFNEDKKGVEQYSTSNKNFVYYGGATYNVKSKEVSMVAICNNRDEFKHIMTYLAAGKREKLTFGYQQDWCYDAVITNVSAATFHDDGRELVVEWKVTFGLYGNGEAIWNNFASYEFGAIKENGNYYLFGDTIDNDLWLPIIIPSKNVNTYYLFSQGNGYNYINIAQNNAINDYYIKINGKYVCQYSFTKPESVRIKGKIGTYKNGSGEFLESLSDNGYNNGLLWFKQEWEIIEVKDVSVLRQYDKYLYIQVDSQKRIRTYITNIDANPIESYKDTDFNQADIKYQILALPTILEVSQTFDVWDTIEIEKHNNF